MPHDFPKTTLQVRRAGWTASLLTMIVIGSAAPLFAQALPGVPSPPSPAAAKDAPKDEAAAPTKDNPEATVTASAAPIDVDKPVDEFKVKDFLEETLSKYPGVYEVHAEVEGSVVTLTGHVEDDAVRDRLKEVALKVEGVVFVANKILTDAQFLSAPQLLMKRLGQYGAALGQNWLLFLLALGLFAVSLAAARLFSKYSEYLLAPLTGNALLRSVLGSMVSAAIIAGGLLAALQVFGIASAVMSVLGLAGVAALAIGFAFRDITENFIASILLSTRRPFHVGDYVEVAGNAGVVKALNTRATILLTLEGKTIRIPNATVFKETVTNSSASSSARSTFDVLVPYEASTVQAMDLIGEALRQHEAILNEPPPRALVEELTPTGVKLRA
jgi:small-conductance mechanosensitive channel